jgi:hypothetical protein
MDCDRCTTCDDELHHCHEASLEHADGTTECLDAACDLAHDLHRWQLTCAVLDPPCGCVPAESEPFVLAGERRWRAAA